VNGMQKKLFSFFLSILICISIFTQLPLTAFADRDSNSYDGNIFALYAGNGAIVPPSTSLEVAIKEKRPILLAFYLDDNSASKRFAPLLSDLQSRWGKDVELIALSSDPYSVDPKAPITSPSHYWNGYVPHVVVIDSNSMILYNSQGDMTETEIETALAKATGRSLDDLPRSSQSFNEYNSEFRSK
jgi:hypothetical protein